MRLIRALLRQPGAEDFEAIAGRYREKHESDREKLERITFYAQGAHCRWKMLLEYFSEAEGFTACGKCDNCRRPAVSAPAAPTKWQPAAKGADLRCFVVGGQVIASMRRQAPEGAFEDRSSEAYFANAEADERGAVPEWRNEMSVLTWHPWLTFNAFAA